MEDEMLKFHDPCAEYLPGSRLLYRDERYAIRGAVFAVDSDPFFTKRSLRSFCFSVPSVVHSF